MGTFHYYFHSADLPTTDHTAGNYHSKFPIPKGIYMRIIYDIYSGCNATRRKNYATSISAWYGIPL